MTEECKNPQAMLRGRQVHLDFHTSEAIEGIASQFDAPSFARTLSRANVDSVTCFARCHHGWLYYDSQTYPQNVHPHLENRNLLKEQIEACHKENIRVPIYITVQFDHLIAAEHPEWTILSPEGELYETKPFEAGFYRYLCLNTPYTEYVKKITGEVLDTLPVDGLFFDIIFYRECVCRHCVEGMLKKGYDPEKKSDRMAYNREVISRFCHEMTSFIREKNKDCTIFYNSSHIGPRSNELKNAYSHFEIESLPAGDWGYIHFPYTSRYTRTLEKPFLGMTGKFHTCWGDFHSLKNQAALEYECFTMLSLGGGCSIGDQLLPGGALNEETYDLIGSVYESVKAKEPWCVNSEALTDMAILTSEEGRDGHIILPEDMLGAVRMLEELGHQFDIIDSYADFSAYGLIILPDNVSVREDTAVKLRDYADKGGKLLGLFESIMEKKELAALFQVEEEETQPLTKDGIPKRNVIPGERNEYAEYLKMEKDSPFAAGLKDTEYVQYRKGYKVRSLENGSAHTEGWTVLSHFDRDWRHFCSHKQTPSSGKVEGPAVVRAGNRVYLSHPHFSLYYQRAPRWSKVLVGNALDYLLETPLVRHDGPSSLRVQLRVQKNEGGRKILHLLHYIPERRGKEFDIVEDVIPLYDINITIRCGEKPSLVKTVPEERELDWDHDGICLNFTVPEINGHTMISIE